MPNKVCFVCVRLFLPFEYEFTCISCVHNVAKGKNELTGIL